MMNEVRLGQLNIKEQVEEIADTLRAKFEASQQEREVLHEIKITALRKQLVACQKNRGQAETNLAKTETKLSSRNDALARDFLLRRRGRRLFSSWRDAASAQKRRASAVRRLIRRRRRRQLAASLARWSKSAKTTAEEERVAAILKEVISKYERELHRLREKLTAADQEVLEGIADRKRLEEQTRTLLLRGMAAMNLDALQLFSGRACEEPQDDGGPNES